MNNSVLKSAKSFWIFGVLLLWSIPAFSQKIPVSIQASGTDRVGENYVFYLKEALRQSASFTLVEERFSARPHIVLSIVSVDESTGGAGNSSAISIAMAYDSINAPINGIYITNMVQTCGSLRAQNCAQDTLPSIDKAVSYLRDKQASYWTSLTIGNDDWLLRSRAPAPTTTPQPAKPKAAKPKQPDNPF